MIFPLIVTVISCFSNLIGAMIVTRYEKTSTPVTADFMNCGTSASNMDYCAARVTTDGTCEPLTRDWCETKDMSIAGSYFIKRTMINMPEVPLITEYEERVPIKMKDGSEVEIKFMLHTDCHMFRHDLSDKDNHIILSTTMMPPAIFHFTWGHTFAQANQNASGYYNNNPFPQTLHNNVIYKLRIVPLVTSNEFEIYLDGEYILTYNTPYYSVSNITNMWAGFYGFGGIGDLYYTSYKAGN